MFNRQILNIKYVITYRNNWHSDNWTDIQTDNLMNSSYKNIYQKTLIHQQIYGQQLRILALLT